MTGHQCACGQPAPTTTICTDCTDRLAKDLGDVPAYALELETVLTRQTRYGDRGDGSRSTTRALPFDLRASEATYVLGNTLSTWTRLVAEKRAYIPPDGLDTLGYQVALGYNPPRQRPLPADTVTAMSRWLLREVPWLARHEAGDQAADEIASAVANVRRVIDRPADRIYAGICSAPLDGAEEATTATTCDADLYAMPGRQYVTCKACGASWDVNDRRELLLDQLEDVLATATEIARGVSRLGQPVAAERIRQWKARSRIEVRGVNLRGDPLYRIGDVLDRLADEATRAAAS